MRYILVSCIMFYCGPALTAAWNPNTERQSSCNGTAQTFWNAGTQRCLAFGRTWDRKRDSVEPQNSFIKTGASAEGNLEVTNLRPGPSGTLVRYGSDQLICLAHLGTLEKPLPPGESAKWYGLSTRYHPCVFPNVVSGSTNLLTSDMEEDCHADVDGIRFVVPDEEWRLGAWIVTPPKGNATSYRCLTAASGIMPELKPQISVLFNELQPQIPVWFKECRKEDRNQRWFVCDGEIKNCTQTLKNYFF